MSATSGTDSSHLDDRKKRELIDVDPNFIAIKRFNWSLDDLLERYPDGVPDHIIAAALLIEEEEIEVMYQNIVGKLRELMKVI